MKSKEELVDEIRFIADNEDSEKLGTLLKEISDSYNYKWLELIEDTFLEDYLEPVTKIKFSLMAMKFRSNNGEFDNNLFIRQVIPYLLILSIKRDKKEFSRLIKEQPDMQKIIVDYFKEAPVDGLEIWDSISNFSITKNEILEDEGFIAEKLKQENSFFSRLPKGYEYLISYYGPEIYDYDFKYLQSLYKQYYNGVLDDEQQTKLIALQYYLILKQGVLPEISMQPLNFILKGVKRDSKLIEKIESLAQKTKLNFIQTSILVYKYRDSDLLNELIDNKEVSDKLREKLEYLSKANRIIDINSIEDLNNASIEDLNQMEREATNVSIAYGRGGPVAKTNLHIFPDSYYREVRRINTNGEINSLTVGPREGHDEAVARIYLGDIEFPENCETAFDRSIEAAKQLSSVTLVLESEQCHMYMPSDITPRQIEKCMELVESAIEKGKFGVVIYDSETDTKYIESIELFDKKETKDLLTRLRKKVVNKDEKTDLRRETAEDEER